MNRDRRTPASQIKGSLVCWKCETNSIPTPVGATDRTRYICPSCVEPGVAGSIEDLQLQRWQFDPRNAKRGVNNYENDIAAAHDLKYKAVAIRGNNPDDARDDNRYLSSAPRTEWRRLKKACKGQPLGASPRFEKAIQDGESWALALNNHRDLLWSLPQKQGLALLWSIWGGLSGIEIARCLGMVTREGANLAIRRAKKALTKSVATSPATIRQVEGKERPQEFVVELEEVET